MLHTRLVVHRLSIDDVDIDLRFATLVAALRAESAQLDWEVVADATAALDVLPGRHRLVMVCVTGADDDGALQFADMEGDAILVRVVERSAVLRGDGPLTGLSLDLLTG